MERLTSKCSELGYTVIGLNSVIKDNADIIGKMINKLAEYENLGTVKEFRDAKLAQVLLVPELQKENKELKHELEVYKRALTKCMDYAYMLRRNSGSVNWYPDESDFYDQARKELEDETRNGTI